MSVAATLPEMAVMKALESLGIQFEFQSKILGEYREKGSAIADFYIPSLSIIIRVHGEYWHYGREDVQARDDIQKLALESQGITVVDINAEDALRNAKYYVSEALKGISYA